MNKQPKDPKFYASVICINPFDQVLLGLRKEDGIWTPAGGSAEDHETPESAALRELFEESGIIAHRDQLQALPTIATSNGKNCHCFLFNCGVHNTTYKLDPDKEISKFEWFFKDELPEGLKKDPRRFESVRNAFMKKHGIIKGGPGSGVDGHVTTRENGDRVLKLNDKLIQMNPFKEALHKLTAGATWEDKELSSGKPVYLKVDQATAHGYTPEDFKEAGNLHYDHMKKMSDQIQKIKDLGKPVPPEMSKIQQFHEKSFKQNFAQAERVSNRTKKTEASIKEKNRDPKKVKKSVVMMGHADGAEVDTAKFALEHKITQESGWYEKIHQLMDGYNYGDLPRNIELNNCTLHLVKFDEGMYSGYVVKHEVVNSGDPNEPSGILMDNAKVRIERMTIPTLVQFLIAKEYIATSPLPIPVQMEPQPVNDLIQKLEHPLDCPGCDQCVMPQVESMMDKKIKMLELINKLVHHV